MVWELVVCVTAKIHFLKQFTTLTLQTLLALMLFVLLQRYTFWSNSQQRSIYLLWGYCCLCYCKDTLFEAIHNWFWRSLSVKKLFVLLQRYTFWSNSQQPNRYSSESMSEAQYIVSANAKILILKQITTLPRLYESNGSCVW